MTDYDELRAKYPCPESLEMAKEAMYRPVALIGWMNQKYLVNKGEKETGFFGRKPNDKRCQWIIYPLENGKVCFKSVHDGLNLGMFERKEMGWGFVSDKPEVNEIPIQ